MGLHRSRDDQKKAKKDMCKTEHVARFITKKGISPPLIPRFGYMPTTDCTQVKISQWIWASSLTQNVAKKKDLRNCLSPAHSVYKRFRLTLGFGPQRPNPSRTRLVSHDVSLLLHFYRRPPPLLHLLRHLCLRRSRQRRTRQGRIRPACIQHPACGRQSYQSCQQHQQCCKSYVDYGNSKWNGMAL